MAAILTPSRFIFGTGTGYDDAEIANLPADTVKVRRRFRGGDFAVAYVKTKQSISRHYLEIVNGALMLSRFKLGENITQ